MRLVASVLLLVVALGAAGALAYVGLQRAPGDTGEYPVLAVGPSGVMLDATARVENATVLRALLAAAAQAGIEVELEEYPMGTYVRAIGGHRAGGPSGWIYEIERDGAWTSGDRSAALFALQKGDAVRWSWTDG